MIEDFGFHHRQRQFDRAQREYDNKMPPDDAAPMSECDQCGEEYPCEFDDDGELVHAICEKCRKRNEEGPQS